MPEYSDPMMGPLPNADAPEYTRERIFAGEHQYAKGTRVSFRRSRGGIDLETVSGRIVRCGSSLGQKYYYVQVPGEGTPAVIAESSVLASLPGDTDRDTVEQWLETP